MASPDFYEHPRKDPDEFINYKYCLIETLQNFLSLLHKFEEKKKINQKVIKDFADKLGQVKYWIKFFQKDDDLTQAQKDKFDPLCQNIFYELNLSLDNTTNGPSFFKALDYYNKGDSSIFHFILQFLLEDNLSYLQEVLIPDIHVFIQDVIHL